MKVLERPSRGQTSFHLLNHEVICSSSATQHINIKFNTGHMFDKLLTHYLSRSEHIRSFGSPESAKLFTSQYAFRDNSAWLWRMILKQLNGEIALVYYVSLLSSLLTQHEKCEESEGYWKMWSKQNADTEIKVSLSLLLIVYILWHSQMPSITLNESWTHTLLTLGCYAWAQTRIWTHTVLTKSSYTQL